MNGFIIVAARVSDSLPPDYPIADKHGVSLAKGLLAHQRNARPSLAMSNPDQSFQVRLIVLKA